MKRCPECRKDYLDDSLLYCLDDGTPLLQSSVGEEPATAVFEVPPLGGSSSDDATRMLKAGTTAASKDSRLSELFSRQRLPWIVACVFALIAAAAIGYGYFNRTTANSGAVRLAFEPPADLSFNDVQPDWAVISPDGQKIAFSAAKDGKNMLYVRDLDSADAKLLPGSENPIEPFWSPDSKSVAYGSNGKLKRSDLNGGKAQVLCDAARMVGGSWGKDGTIVFVADYRTMLLQVSGQGGEPKPVAVNAEAGNDERHRYPYFLPDGRHFVFYRELKGIWAGSLDSPEIVQVAPDNSPVVYSKQGYLIFIRNEALVAQAFDPNRLAPSGDAIPIISGQKSWSWINNFRFSASDNGVFVWQGVWEREYQLTWFDREGKPVGTVEAPATVSVGMDPQISPDGKRVAVKRNPPNKIWVIDLEKGTSVPITSDFGQMPVWSPDGSRLAYSGVGGLVTKSANGLGDAEIVIPVGATFPHFWSHDGRWIIFSRRGVKSRLDMYAVSMDGDRKESLLLSSPFDEQCPALSPDGKWLAYGADDTGSYEIYIQSFSADGKLGSDRKRISITGGRMPVWRRDGSELFFIASDGQLMSAASKLGGSDPEFSTPKALFKTRTLSNVGSVHEFDISPDGERFLIGTLVGESTAPPPTVILNWPELLKK
jgi:Tol biopolymer transport system component